MTRRRQHPSMKSKAFFYGLITLIGVTILGPLAAFILSGLDLPEPPSFIVEVESSQIAWERFWDMAELEDPTGLSVPELVKRYALTPELAERIQEEGFPLKPGVDYDEVEAVPPDPGCEGTCGAFARLLRDGRPAYTVTATVRAYSGVGWRCASYAIAGGENGKAQ